MNERIEKLAKQAEIKFESHPQHQGIDTAVIIPTDLAKFAELIVQECIGCSDMVGKNNLASGYPNSTAHHVKQKIKEHFGVEE